VSEQTDEVTIACSLGVAQRADRRAMWETLARAALTAPQPTADGVEHHYSASDGVECQLRRLARLEGECCSFAEWRVRRQGDELVLTVTSHGDGVAAVRALFNIPSATLPAANHT
jgi:hypothetical protein